MIKFVTSIITFTRWFKFISFFLFDLRLEINMWWRLVLLFVLWIVNIIEFYSSFLLEQL